MDKEQESNDAKIAKALKDAEVAKRRATMALGYAKEALRLSASTPRIGAMLRDIEKELQGDLKGSNQHIVLFPFRSYSRRRLLLWLFPHPFVQADIGANRVQMHVITGGLEIAVAAIGLASFVAWLASTQIAHPSAS